MSCIQLFLVSVISACVTSVLTPVITFVACYCGITERPEVGRSFRSEVPRCGGIAVATGYVTAVVFASGMGWIPGQFSFLLAVGLMALIGVADDVAQLTPRSKLLGQTTMGLFAYYQGYSLEHVLPPLPMPGMALIGSIGWIVAVTNAFNLIDGLDGLCSGLGAIGAISLASAALIAGRYDTIMLAVPLAASLVSFLYYNIHPAKIILGDTGSLFIGFTLSLLALNTDVSQSKDCTPFIALVIILGVPLFDTTLAVWRRSMRGGDDSGRSWLQRLGSYDSEHIHHRLLREGLSVRQACLLLWRTAAVLGIVSVVIVSCVRKIPHMALIPVVIVPPYLLYLFGRAEVIMALRLASSLLVRLVPSKNSRMVLMLWDVTVTVGGCLWIFHQGSIADASTYRLLAVVGTGTFVITSLWLLGNYHTVWAQSTPVDYAAIWFIALLAPSISLGFAPSDVGQSNWCPILIHWVCYGHLLFGSMAAARVLMVIFDQAISRRSLPIGSCSSLPKRILLYIEGSGSVATIIAGYWINWLQQVEGADVAGILLGNMALQDCRVNGVKILGSGHSIDPIVKDATITEVLIVAPDDSLMGAYINRIARSHRKRVRYYSSPHMTERTDRDALDSLVGNA